jgi:ubiquitin carboxyl-terminal hydrolase 9/13
MGSWLVFDDDNVYPIPEADIPKYFGESNSGSAYILYYQAADIDLSALGLRPLPVPTPAEDVEIFSHLEVSPSAPMNPPLPLGQVEEGDLLDTSDTAFPFTPPSPQDARQLIDMARGHVEEPVPTPVLTKGNALLTNLGSEADNNQTKAPQSHHDDTSKTMFSHGDPEEIKTGTFVIYSSHDERTV